MEWVETIARSIEEAKDAALDQLGIDEQEAEFEIVEEPRAGLFGRVRGEARVRARVAPKQPRPRQERQRRGARSDQPSASGGTEVSEHRAGTESSVAGNGGQPSSGDADESPRRRGGRSDARGRAAGQPERGAANAHQKETRVMDDTIVPVEEQAEIIGGFLGGLLTAFHLDGEVRQAKADDDTIELDLQGDDLGLLIGPKGQTLTALHELSRTVLQRQATGRYEGRVRIDVSGYRMKRREALARFVVQVAQAVRDSGVQKALEPMNSADRKVVHDTVNDLEAVSTRSDGQEPNRRVVIMPDTAN